MGMRYLNDSGQMAVEMVMVMPVLIVVCIIVVDLGVYLGDCARFDRLAPQIVRLHASSPDSDEYASSANVASMQTDLEDAMDGGERIAIQVVCDGGAIIGGGGGVADALISFIPQPQSYTCTMDYAPWPLDSGAFGFAPGSISHSRTYVIDPYRPGALL